MARRAFVAFLQFSFVGLLVLFVVSFLKPGSESWKLPGLFSKFQAHPNAENKHAYENELGRLRRIDLSISAGLLVLAIINGIALARMRKG